MTIEELKKKYGTATISILLRRLASNVNISPFLAKEVEQISKDLESALENSK